MPTINGLKPKQQKFFDKVHAAKGCPEIGWQREDFANYVEARFSFEWNWRRYEFNIEGRMDNPYNEVVKLARKAFRGKRID